MLCEQYWSTLPIDTNFVQVQTARLAYTDIIHETSELAIKILEWPQINALCIKSTSRETVFFSVKEENRNSHLNQAYLDNNHLKLC